MFDPTTIGDFLKTVMTPEFIEVSVLTFFSCYGLFKALEPRDPEGRWAAAYKVGASLVFGTVWGVLVIAPVQGSLVAGAILGFIAGGATTITVDQFKH
jgi:hypothetical protein